MLLHTSNLFKVRILHYSHMGIQGCEWVGGHFRTGFGDSPQQSGLPSIRKSNLYVQRIAKKLQKMYGINTLFQFSCR